MFLLYLDEAGGIGSADHRHFVLGGLAVFERQPYFLSKALDELQASLFPERERVVFHTSSIRTGRGFWRRVPVETKQRVLHEIGKILGHPRGPTLFAVALEKTDRLKGEEAVREATEQICRRFDLFINRMSTDPDNRQRGLAVLEESQFRKKSNVWVKGFRRTSEGTRWGRLMNFADAPFFAKKDETRLLQLADYVAHAVFQLYERRDRSLITPLLDRFDQEGGKLHGLVHVTSKSWDCECPACFRRNAPRLYGGWIEDKRREVAPDTEESHGEEEEKEDEGGAIA